MATAIINIKTDVKIKKEAQKISSELGLSLSSAINGFLKQMIRDKKVFFSLDESSPSEYLLSSVANAKKERKSGNFYKFKNNEEALNFLDSH